MQDQSPTQPPYNPYNQPAPAAQPQFDQQSYQQPYQQQSYQAPARNWKMPALVGGLVGLGILAGAFVLKGQGTHSVAASANPAGAAAPTALSTSPASAATGKAGALGEPGSQNGNASAATNPSQPNAQTAPSTPSQTVAQVPGTNASVVGGAGSKNVRSGPGTNFDAPHIAYPGDRVEVIGSGADREGTTWYQVYFPKSQVKGWMSSILISLDPGTPVPANTDSTGSSGSGSAKPAPTPDTNATIVGEAGSKNVRKGPGTENGVAHIAYPGDRVKILDSAQDGGGLTWYKVSFPQSGAQGWVAGQLLKID
jgi:serine/threonine protein kinase, bacterial